MTNIVNEMTCGNIELTYENINLTGDIKVSKAGELHSIAGGTVYEITSADAQKQYLGSFNISKDQMTAKRNISININDIAKVSIVASAIEQIITDIENKYKV